MGAYLGDTVACDIFVQLETYLLFNIFGQMLAQ
jgi:hypothetical protein